MSAEQSQVDPRYRPDSLFIQYIEQDEFGDCTELGEDTTHCYDRINETDTEYIRADLVESLRARVRELEGEQGILNALMLELKGQWPQYQHYANLLNEARGFEEARKPK